MKKLFLLASITLLALSCQNKENNTTKEHKEVRDIVPDSAISFELVGGDVMQEQILHLKSNHPVGDTVSAVTSPTNPLDELDLPEDFTSRDFLTNSSGYRDNLELLVGMVVKKELLHQKYVFTAVQDFKKDSVKITTSVPASGTLVEKNYDSSVSASVKYLTAAANVEANTAVRILINDVGKITIDGKAVDKQRLYDAYHNDAEISQYYLITSATTTSILFKKYTKMRAGANFDASAIKVGATYYNSSDQVKQDWKLGMSLVKVSEYLKGFRPAQTSPQSATPNPKSPTQ